MTGSTWSAIDTAFHDEGVTPIPEPEDADGSVRRTRTQEYLNSVDWTDAGEVSRAIRAFERLLVDVRPDGVYGASNAWDAFVRAMERDGYEVTDAGHINATAGAALQAMITDESLTVSEVVQWWAGAISHREAARLRQLTAQAHNNKAENDSTTAADIR